MFFAFRASWELVYLWFPFLSLCQPISSQGSVNDFELYTIQIKAQMAEGVVTDSNLPLFSAEEVQQHSTEKDAWIIHHGKVYDVSEFLERHSGGKVILFAYTGLRC